jgi:hypothetical protein
MHSIRPITVGRVLPPIDTLISGRPSSWIGMRVDWSSTKEPVPVFLGTFSAPTPDHGREVFLFGARYDLSEALVDGQSYAPGYFVEYFVVWEMPSKQWQVHRLLQRGGDTYREDEEQSRDCVDAKSIKQLRTLCADKPPKWKRSEAHWPICDEKPMIFLGQLALPDTKVARELFTWNTNVYLFFMQRQGSIAFKVFEQASDFQTAEEHYASEDTNEKL